MPLDFDKEQAAKELAEEIKKIDMAAADPVDDSTSTPDPEPEPEGDPEEPTPEDDEPTSDVGEGDDDPGEGEPEEPTQDDEPEDEEDDKPALPDSHYRAALRMGWTAEEIGELYDKSPEAAKRMVAKCYESVNAASQQLGRLGVLAQKAKQAEQATPAAQPQADDRYAKLINRVKDHYGEDDPTAEVLAELLKDKQQAAQQPQAKQDAIPKRTVEEEIAARQQIQTFFSSDEMKAYDELYGSDDTLAGDLSKLTPGQRANRIEVCNRAQLILYGAEAAGMEMSTAEALERAHLEIAAPMAEQIVRTRLAKSARKREKGVTLRPGGKKQAPPKKEGFNKQQAAEELRSEHDWFFGS